jgi:Peptidase family C25
MTDKVIVTNLGVLRRKYGRRLRTIRRAINRLIAADKRRGLHTRLVALDAAGPMKRLRAPVVQDALDPQQNKAAIDAVYRKLTPHYLMILGAPDVVPYQDVQNPVYDGKEDPDPCACGDLPYACDAPYSRKPQDFIAPTRVVGRLPDVNGASDPAYLAQLLTTAASWQPGVYSAYFGISTRTWQRSSSKNVRLLFGESKDLAMAPPNGPKWTAAQLQRPVHFINCHGAPADFRFYGEKGNNQPVSHDARLLGGRIGVGSVAAVECCYGTELYDPQHANGHAGIANVYLESGAYAFVGSTTIAYGPSTTNNDADLVCQFFLRRMLDGASLGRAFLEARQEFAQRTPELDPVNLKTLAQFTLLGDPSIQPVADAHGVAAAPRSARKSVAAADTERVERADRRRALAARGHAIAITQASAVRTRGRRPRAIDAALLAAARRAGLARPSVLSFGVRRPVVPRAAITAKAALPPRPKAAVGFHVVLGTRGRGKTVPHVVALVAKEIGGKVVSLREALRR